MVAYSIEGSVLELPRNLALLDSNALVALIDDRDDHHEDAQLFFEAQEDYILAVAPPVIAEAWGVIRSRRPDRAHKLIQTILDPGVGIRILPAPHHVEESHVQDYLHENANWMQKFAIDYVDAFLMGMADRITLTCDMSPFIVIVTTDLRDFPRCLNGGYSYGVYVLGSNETFFPNSAAA